MSVLLEIKNLKKYFPMGNFFNRKYIHAVDNISFQLEQGEVLGIVGESGSGKSTLARVITHLEEKTAGNVFFKGKEQEEYYFKNRKKAINYKKSIQMIFQDPFSAFNPMHNIKSELSFPLKMRYGKMSQPESHDKISELLKLVNLLPADKYIYRNASQLSGGERQRVLIARALAMGAELIVADEPTSMLDVSTGINIRNLLLELKEREGLSYIYITHNIGGAKYMADRIAVMYAGEIVELASAYQITNQPLHPYTRMLLSVSPDPFSERVDKEVKVLGEPPDLIDPGTGCRFAPRCQEVMEDCFRLNPVLLAIGEGRFNSCLRFARGKVAKEVRGDTIVVN